MEFLVNCVFIDRCTEFSRVQEAARNTQQFMYARDTAKNIRSHFRTYFLFCLHFQRRPLPAESQTLVCFVEYMSQTCGYKHIKHLIGSVKLLHRIFNCAFVEDDYPLDSALQSIKRKCAGTPLQVFPIYPKTLMAMVMFLDLSEPQNQALWTAWLCCFYLMFRKKSAVPESLAKFDPQIGLTRSKIKVFPEKNLALVYCNFSKVIQFRERQMVIPLIGSGIPSLNVIYHLNKLFTENPCPDDSPAFSYYKNGRLLCITFCTFTKQLKTCLKKAGYNPELYSGHSFRRGGASWAYKAGCTSTEIKCNGDWRSDTWLQYTWLDLDQRLSAQQKMVNFI